MVIASCKALHDPGRMAMGDKVRAKLRRDRQRPGLMSSPPHRVAAEAAASADADSGLALEAANVQYLTVSETEWVPLLAKE